MSDEEANAIKPPAPEHVNSESVTVIVPFVKLTNMDVPAPVKEAQS